MGDIGWWFIVTRQTATGRQVINGALCGTPAISNNDSLTQRRLFPTLASNIKYMGHRLIAELYRDKEFYKWCFEYAFNELKFHSEERGRERILKAYEVGRKEK